MTENLDTHIDSEALNMADMVVQINGEKTDFSAECHRHNTGNKLTKMKLTPPHQKPIPGESKPIHEKAKNLKKRSETK